MLRVRGEEKEKKPLEYEGKEFPVEYVKVDEEGYVKSFSVEEKELYMAFFNKFGFVIIRDVIPKDQIKRSIEDIWQVVEGCSKLTPLSRDNPKTWKWWPGLPKLGLLSQALSHTAWENRVSPKLYEVFCTILGRKDLWSSVDNWGVLRPTKNVPTQPLPPLPKGELRISAQSEITDIPRKDRPEWVSQSSWLHWDLNPFYWLGEEKDGVDYEFVGDFISENNGSKNSGG